MAYDRNELCWCGSGLKFKRCHLGREKLTPLQRHEISHQFEQIYNEAYCLHPDVNSCSTKIIAAHTVQKSGQLDAIAKDGHVYAVDRNYLNAIRALSSFRLEGVRRTSTYRCFCGQHDDDTFKPIDTKPFSFTPEQCFLIGYRALCRGLYLCRQQVKTFPLFRQLDRGNPLAKQKDIQQRAVDRERAVKARRDAFEEEKQRYDVVLRTGSLGDIGSFSIEFASVPDILASDVLLPLSDFAGAQLQTLAIHTPIRLLTLSLITLKQSGGAAVFVWHKQHEIVASQLVDSLRALSAHDIPDGIVRLVFSLGANFFISPVWWEGLSASNRTALEHRFLAAMRGQNSLLDDGTRVASWLVTGYH